jgi:hypothetical protein
MFGAVRAGPTCLLRVLAVAKRRPEGHHPQLDMTSIRGGGWRECLFGHMYRVVRRGAYFSSARWFVAAGSPAEVVRGLVAYGVDPLELIEEDNSPGYRPLCARAFMENVACPGMLDEIRRVQPFERTERDRLILCTRYLWTLCWELYALDYARWADRALAVMQGMHPRLGRGSWLSRLEPTQLVGVMRDMQPPPDEPAHEMGERVNALRLFEAGS